MSTVNIESNKDNNRKNITDISLLSLTMKGIHYSLEHVILSSL